MKQVLTLKVTHDLTGSKLHIILKVGKEELRMEVVSNRDGSVEGTGITTALRILTDAARSKFNV